MIFVLTEDECTPSAFFVLREAAVGGKGYCAAFEIRSLFLCPCCGLLYFPPSRSMMAIEAKRIEWRREAEQNTTFAPSTQTKGDTNVQVPPSCTYAWLIHESKEYLATCVTPSPESIKVLEGVNPYQGSDLFNQYTDIVSGASHALLPFKVILQDNGRYIKGGTAAVMVKFSEIHCCSQRPKGQILRNTTKG